MRGSRRETYLLGAVWLTHDDAATAPGDVVGVTSGIVALGILCALTRCQHAR